MIPKPYKRNLRDILLEIGNELSKEDFERLKFLCKDDFNCFGDWETTSTPIQLFEKLIQVGKIQANDTKYLERLLEQINRKPLMDKLQNYALQNSKHAVGISGRSVGQEYGLPEKRATFFGRDALVEKIAERFTKVQKRMIAVVAPPGFGKSCVVTHVGHFMMEQGFHIIFVSLRQITSCFSICSEILSTLDPYISLSDDVIQQTKNRLLSLEGPKLLILDNTEDIQNSDSSHEFQSFIEILGSEIKKLRILLGSRKNIQAKYFDSESINLPQLDEKSSLELLVAFADNARFKEGETEHLSVQCVGVPLLIRIAAGYVNNGWNPTKLANMLQNTPHDVMNLKGDELMEHLSGSIRIFLDSISKGQRVTLIKLSCFPAEFTEDVASEIFFNKEVECLGILSSLHSNALLQLNGNNYSLHPLIQTFCREEQERMKCHKEGEKAMKTFTYHYFDKVEELHRKFVSHNCQEGLQQFYSFQMNLKQAFENALKCSDKRMKVRCIDAFSGSINLLGKILLPKNCLEVYQQLYDAAEKMKDKKRMSECLVSIGFRHMCEVDHGKFSQDAFDALESALSLWKKTRLSKTSCYTEAYAHCLSKLGLCYVAKGEVEKGKKMINEAIPIRYRLGDKVLIAASYCDKAIAARMCNKHEEAIKLLEEKCLPAYNKHLGDHPWVASLFVYISKSYQDLGRLDEAIDYSRRSLHIREKLLGDHQDTARSHVRLGELYQEEENMEDAYNAFRKALSIQENVLGVHEETAATYEVVKGILNELNLNVREEQDIIERSQYCSDELKKKRTIQRQISEDIKRRANSVSEFHVQKNMIFLVIFVVLVGILISLAVSLH